MINRSTLVAILALLGAAAPARAQGIDSPYDFVDPNMSVWVFGSYVFADRGSVDTGPGSAPGAGVGYTYRITGPFNIDTRVAYLPTSRRIYDVLAADSAAVREDPMAGLDRVGEADLSLLLLDASLRFDITGPRTWYRLQPYALIGAGGVLALSSDNSAEENLSNENADIKVRFQNGFTGHIGGGVEWYVTDRFTVRADARDVFWKLHIPRGFERDGRIIDFEPWVQSAHLNLGISVRF